MSVPGRTERVKPSASGIYSKRAKSPPQERGCRGQRSLLQNSFDLCEMNTSRKESLKAHQQQHYDDQNFGLTYLASLGVGGEACDLVGGSHGSHLLWPVRA